MLIPSPSEPVANVNNAEFFAQMFKLMEKKNTTTLAISSITGDDPVFVDHWVLECQRCRKANKWDDDTYVIRMAQSVKDRAKKEWIRFDHHNQRATPEQFIQAI